MAQLYYSKEHEWISVDGDIATIGITNHAQEQLGDIVFVEVPEVGRAVKPGDAGAVVESVKAASEVYVPISGAVTEANTALSDAPELVNDDAEGAAWFFKLRLSDMSELEALMDRAAYDAFVASEG